MYSTQKPALLATQPARIAPNYPGTARARYWLNLRRSLLQARTSAPPAAGALSTDATHRKEIQP